MYQWCALICSIGGLILHVPCMQLSLETLALLGFGAAKEYLLVLDPNVLYTPHA